MEGVRLTFDDGPSEWTPGLLDLLLEHDERAAFFVTGAHAHAHPEIVTRAAAEGHVVGNHGYRHKRLTDLSSSDVIEDLYSTSTLIERLTGRRPVVWRAPFFGRDEHVEMLARDLGMEHVGADVIPDDWRRTDPQEIASRVLAAWKPGKIVCLHDGVPPGGGSSECTHDRGPTVQAVRLILEAWA